MQGLQPLWLCKYRDKHFLLSLPTLVHQEALPAVIPGDFLHTFFVESYFHHTAKDSNLQGVEVAYWECPWLTQTSTSYMC